MPFAPLPWGRTLRELIQETPPREEEGRCRGLHTQDWEDLSTGALQGILTQAYLGLLLLREGRGQQDNSQSWKFVPNPAPPPVSLWLEVALHALWHLQLLHSSGGG